MLDNDGPNEGEHTPLDGTLRQGRSQPRAAILNHPDDRGQRMRRHDVSSVPLQGGYLAKQCPVRAQNDAIVPAERVPVPPILERRFERGRQFELSLVADILKLHGDACVATGASPAALEASTLKAIAKSVPLILGGRLPPDISGRRVGKPDLLVHAREGGYRPVDIKHHGALEPALPDRRGIPGLWSSLDRPWFEDAAVDDLRFAKKRESDLLQLAHYQRMLEAAGFAAPDGRYGGIIGAERRLVWYDLDAPIWHTPASSGRQKGRTTMEVYDFEFDFRLDVIAVAEAHERDPSVELLVVPVRVGECGECPWWDYCRPQLESGSGDVSLLPRVGWRQWKIHRDHAVNSREALAALDVRTARLVGSGVDVAEMQRLIEGLPEETPVADLGVVIRSKSQLSRLVVEGVHTFGELSSLCSQTASYSGAGLSGLADQIDLARAALGPDPVYRRRGVDMLTVPRADVEIDVDMENIEQGVYLWGALVTERFGPVAMSEYHPFVTWEPLTAEVETQNSLEFWRWFIAIRSAARDSGRSFRAYCYNASAENTYLRKLGLAAGIVDEITVFTHSESWVDMLRVVDSQLITGGGTGLKVIAPIAGFSWQVDEAGGGESMLRYDVAVGSGNATERDDARHWLLTYNRGDVEATLALRDWLEGGTDSIQSVETLEPAAIALPVTDRMA
jgi:predicted RecB family nuclease